MEFILRSSIIGLPLAGALVVWLMGDKHVHAQCRVTMMALILAGLAALSLFLANRYYACALTTGSTNCIEESLVTLLLFAGSLGLLFRCRDNGGLKSSGNGKRYISALLLIGTPAVILINNPLLWFMAWYVFSYVIYRSLRRSGLHWDFFMIHDDYRDDVITKRH